MSTVRVYVDGRGVDAPADGTAIDAVRAADAAAAHDVGAGRSSVTDSRGLPVPPDSRLYHGAIFRVVASRRRASESGAEPER